MTTTTTNSVATEAAAPPQITVSDALIARVKAQPITPIDVAAYRLEKRAPAAFVLFGKHVRPIVKAEYASAESQPNLGTMTCIVSRLWATFGDEERAPFVQASEQLKARAASLAATAAAAPVQAAAAASDNKKRKAKRATSAYVLFCSAKRSETKAQMAAENGGREPTFGEMNSRLSAMWGAATEEQRAPFIAQAAELAQAASSSNKKKRASAPPSAYIVFSKAVRNDVKAEFAAANGGQEPTFGETGKAIGAKWNALSDTEKQVYVERARADAAAEAQA